MKIPACKEYDIVMFCSEYREFRDLTYFNIYGFHPNYRNNLEKMEVVR